jgi:hypothetical protein
VSWNGSIHFSSAGKCLPLSRMQTILQAGLLAPGSSYLPAFPNRGSVALSAFVPVTAAGPLPARIDSTLTGFPITPFRHPEVRYSYIIAHIFCQLLRASIDGASVAPSTGISQRSLPLNLASLGFALSRASAFGNPTLLTSLSNGQDEGRTCIADSCIAENGLEKLATIPARITNASAGFAWGLGGVRGEALAAMLAEGALSPNNCWLSRGGNARPPPIETLSKCACPGHLSLILKAQVGSQDLIHRSYCFPGDSSCVLIR